MAMWGARKKGSGNRLVNDIEREKRLRKFWRMVKNIVILLIIASIIGGAVYSYLDKDSPKEKEAAALKFSVAFISALVSS